MSDAKEDLRPLRRVAGNGLFAAEEQQLLKDAADYGPLTCPKCKSDDVWLVNFTNPKWFMDCDKCPECGHEGMWSQEFIGDEISYIFVFNSVARRPEGEGAV